MKNDRLKAELQMAHDAQMSIMPQTDPEIEGFSISGVCVPAYEVGGDFFDYIWLNREKTKLGIAVGDVSGKAMKSAMTAALTSGMIFSQAFDSVKEIMTRVNHSLYHKTAKRVFTALCLMSVDLVEKEIVFTNAGLNDPMIKSSGLVAPLKGTGSKLPLGIRRASDYVETRAALKRGDVVVIFSDGVSEAKSMEDEFYGVRRLEGLLEGMNAADLSAREIKDRIIGDVEYFAEKTQQHDDITVVVIKAI
ncbi:MAG: PP2C family protein-serine/threonine phosphatase [bacterium]|nr:PP2C family protein-serine/threonine phosphatase [bacterium]